MTSKVERLRALAQVLPEVFPPTAWSPSELDDLSSDGPWYLRVDDDYDGSTGPLTTAEAKVVLQGLSAPAAAQSFIESQLAGAIFVGRRGVVVETVRGDARPLLRGGRAGAVTVVTADGRSWTSKSSDVGPVPADLTERLCALTMPHAGNRYSAVLEWILDGNNRVWIVDMKPVPPLFIRWTLGSRRGDFFVGVPAEEALALMESGTSAGTVTTELETTALSEGDKVESTVGVVRCEKGAVLSHLVTRFAGPDRRFHIIVSGGWEQNLV